MAFTLTSDLHFLDELDQLDVTGRICLLWGHWPCTFCWSGCGQARGSAATPFLFQTFAHPLPRPPPTWLTLPTGPNLPPAPPALLPSDRLWAHHGEGLFNTCPELSYPRVPSLGPQPRHTSLCQGWNLSSSLTLLPDTHGSARAQNT